MLHLCTSAKHTALHSHRLDSDSTLSASCATSGQVIRLLASPFPYLRSWNNYYTHLRGQSEGSMNSGVLKHLAKCPAHKVSPHLGRGEEDLHGLTWRCRGHRALSVQVPEGLEATRKWPSATSLSRSDPQKLLVRIMATLRSAVKEIREVRELCQLCSTTHVINTAARCLV